MVCGDLVRHHVGFGGLTVSRTTGAGCGARRSSQVTDRSRLSPLSDVCVEPGNRVLAESSALRELAGELEAIDGHPRQAGELYHLADPKESHGTHSLWTN